MEEEYNAHIDETPMKRNRRPLCVRVRLMDTTPYVPGPSRKQDTHMLDWLTITKRTGTTIRKNVHTQFDPVSKKMKYTSHNPYHRKRICPCGCDRNQYSIDKYRRDFNRYYVKPSIDDLIVD